MLVLYKLPMNNVLKIVIILLMDALKGFYIKYKNNEKVYKFGCKICKTWRYQFIDKWVDLFGYYLVYLIMKETNILEKIYEERNNYIMDVLLKSIQYRLLGVILFSLTKKSYYLVIFADVFKEFLIYNVLMKNKPYKTGFIIVFILKIVFEYYWHQKHNKIEYSNNLII